MRGTVTLTIFVDNGDHLGFPHENTKRRTKNNALNETVDSRAREFGKEKVTKDRTKKEITANGGNGNEYVTAGEVEEYS